MKKILSSILFLIAILLLQSCYEDKGNYSYHFDKINNIDTLIFKPQAYSGGYEPATYKGLNDNSVQIDYIKPDKPDTIEARINVELVSSIPEETGNFEYYWYRTYNWNKETVKDTVTTNGYMDIKIPGGNSITYNVILEVHDNKNDLSKFMTLSVRTKEWFTNSLFILHGNSNNNMHLGNVEFINGNPIITPDAFEKTNKEESVQNPFARTRLLGFRTNYFDGSEIICFNTDGTAEVFKAFGLQKKYNTQFVMPTSSELFIAKDFINICPSEGSGGQRAVISTNGKFYKSDYLLRFFEPGKDTESTSHLTPDKYTIAGGIRTQEYYLFYDKKNTRFIYTTSGGDQIPKNPTEGRETAVMSAPVLDANVDMSVLTASDDEPTDKYKLNGKELVFAYINSFSQYQQGQESRFIFYDPKTQKNIIYELTPQDNKDKKKEGDDDSKFSITQYSELKDIKLEPGTPIVYNPAYTLDFIFYAEGGTVYRYNVSNGEKEIIYEAPAGYEVSVLKFRQNEDYFYWKKLYLYLSIGLNQNSKGAVAEIKLLTSGDVDNSWAPQLYEGFDNIMDIQYCNELTYGLD